MKTTANYGFKKPDGNDSINNDDFNFNADIIDQKLKLIEDKAGNITVPVTSVNNKTGTVVLSATDIKTGDGGTVASSLADNTQQLATKMEKQIKDDSTTKKYEMGIKGGLLYYREVL
ncbi:hypothetical protein [Clostridium sp. FP1]|uniref:hypothetical protein n=1 Tax=Clostridium sp. FP1 TaxID=2724076 RepID=UPI0013E94A34|nr:hypothetical protein [Clostridium sp. FP1]MBZ9635488.1 hypothetical protein [Clostridium sp. FP1]